MGVYIKGMKMPKGCHETPHGYICPYLLLCKVNRAYVEKTGRAAINKRLDGCPLVEVAEPHGRLVDVNTAYQDTMIYGEKFRKSVLKIIDDLDTVIESEE